MKTNFLLLLLGLAAAQSAHAGLLVYRNPFWWTDSPGFDWNSQVLDPRLPASQQTGDVGIARGTFQLDDNWTTFGIGMVGVEGGFVANRGLAYYVNNSIWYNWPVPAVLGEIDGNDPFRNPLSLTLSYQGHSIPITTHSCAGCNYGFELIEEDGPHYGWYRIELGRLAGWVYQTRPNVAVPAANVLGNLPEPPTAFLMSFGFTICLIAIIQRQNWRRIHSLDKRVWELELMVAAQEV